MAEYGFESNDDYEFRIRCLLKPRSRGLRCGIVEGRAGRRKTSFATALGHAQDFSHVLYHDFSQADPSEASKETLLMDEEDGEPIVPLSAFDRSVSEACALSEAEDTLLILDQLQAAAFREHIRLARFVAEGDFEYPLATLRANPRRFVLLLISEEPVFHSLAREAFRIWTDPEAGFVEYPPETFGYEEDVRPVMEALNRVFQVVGSSPTESEYGRILHDALHGARSIEQVAQCLYGWLEYSDFEALTNDACRSELEAVVAAIFAWHGEDSIEL